MRRALMPTFLARRFRQWSLVSSHERGPPMATSMGRTRSSADTADIAETPAEIDDFAIIGCPMVVAMTRTDDLRSYRTERLGDVLRRVAARLAAQRIENGGHVGAHTLDDVTARCPGGGGCGNEASRSRGFKGVALRREFIGEDRRAVAGRVREAMPASVGTEIQDAALLPPGDASLKQAPRHGLHPSSNRARTTPKERSTSVATFKSAG